MIQSKVVAILSLALLGGVVSGTLAAACQTTPTPPPAELTPVVQEPPSVPVRVAPVTRATIEQVLSYTGDIASGSQIQVVSKASGRIERLNVDVGSQVAVNDPIAQLDTLSLQATLDQSQAGLAAAEARLAGMLAGAKDEDVQAAQAAVDLAKAQLDQASSPARQEQIAAAQAQLNQLRARLAQIRSGAKPEDVAALQADVERARAGVETARQGLDTAAAGTAAAQQQVIGGEEAVASAQAQVTSAQEQVEIARSSITSAQSRVAAASAARDEAALRQAQAQSGQGGPGVRPEDIAAAQAAVDQAWLAWQQLLNTPTPEDVAIAEAGVTAAEAGVTAAEASAEAAEDCDGVGCPDEDAAAAQVEVAEANLERAEAELARVLAGPTEFEIESARQAFEAAEANRDKLRTGGSSDPTALALAITNADAALTQAQVGLEQARSQEAQAQAGMAQAEAGLSSAKSGLGQAQAGLQQAKINEQTAQTGVLAAEAIQLPAQARLDSARNPDTFDVRAAQAAVDQAQAQLDQLIVPDSFNIRTNQANLERAEAQLASARRPFTAEDIQAQQAQVDQQRAAVASAQVALDETTVRAPVAGIVSERLVSEGALVGQTTPIVTLIPPGLELKVAVEESNLAAVAAGQAVTVSVAAYPDREFRGTVRTVSPTVDPQSRTVEVKIDLEDPQGLLRPGMFAQVGIVTLSRPGALLVPRDAVVNLGTEQVVFVVRENRAVRVAVKLGISSANGYEVVEGLQEGEQVVVTGLSDLTDGDPVMPQP